MERMTYFDEMIWQEIVPHSFFYLFLPPSARGRGPRGALFGLQLRQPDLCSFGHLFSLPFLLFSLFPFSFLGAPSARGRGPPGDLFGLQLRQPDLCSFGHLFSLPFLLFSLFPFPFLDGQPPALLGPRGHSAICSIRLALQEVMQ